jgi:hypothetical protein
MNWKSVLGSLLMLLVAGCHDSYRYTCQDPKHFGDAECQKPACEFTQTCPEYLVAPILEKKIEGTSTQVVGQQPQTTASQCR